MIPTLNVRLSLGLLAVAASSGCAVRARTVVDPAPQPQPQPQQVAVVQGAQTQLIVGQSQSNYGAYQIATGFLPDPVQISLVSGGAGGNRVQVSSEPISPVNSGNCRGEVTMQPDVIVNVTQPGQFLRFFTMAQGDTTLVINDGRGNWWCSDDDGGNLNAMIDMANPVPGQYDVWVGSYSSGTNLQAVLGITELPSVHP